jgi:hypothetical protein
VRSRRLEKAETEATRTNNNSSEASSDNTMTCELRISLDDKIRVLHPPPPAPSYDRQQTRRRVAAPRGFAQILAMSFTKLARGKSGRRDFA